MKKSQILAALALAFSLGVVAPVVGVYAAEEDGDETEEPVTESGTTIEKRANQAAVLTAISKVENYGDYKNYKALIDAVNATKNEAGANDYTEIDEALDSLNDAIVAINTSYKDADTIADAKKAAVKVADYSKWAALVTATEDYNNDDVRITDRIKAIKDAAEALGYTVTSTSTDNAVKIQEMHDKAVALTDYQEYKNLIDAYNAADESQTLFDNLGTTLSKVGVSQAIITNKKTIAARVTEATNYVGYDEYSQLATAIADAREDVEDATTKGNQDIIDSINDLLKAATAVVPGEEVSLGDLTPGATTPNNPDEPGTNEPGTEEPGSDDPSAPGTGLVSTAEGNAATTVSIVAGLATALTALGAGVVAYRSARRSNK